MTGIAPIEFRRFLATACPHWTPTELDAVEAKLGCVNIDGVAALKQALSVKDASGLNSMLRAKSQKGFSQKTLDTFSRQLSKHSAERVPPQTDHAEMKNLSSQDSQAHWLTQQLETLSVDNVRLRAGGKPKWTPPQEARGGDVAQWSAEEFLSQLPARTSKERQWTPPPAPPAAWLSLAPGGAEKASTPQEQPDADPAPLLANDFCTKWAARNPSQGVPDAASDFDCFEVVFPKVIVKDAASKNGRSWGFVVRGQNIQVHREQVKDADGNSWVVLTLFELWRLAQGTLMWKRQGTISARGFVLIDGTLMGLGLLLRGPVPRSEWRLPEQEEVCAFSRWMTPPTLPGDVAPPLPGNAKTLGLPGTVYRSMALEDVEEEKRLEVGSRPVEPARDVASRSTVNGQHLGGRAGQDAVDEDFGWLESLLPSGSK